MGAPESDRVFSCFARQLIHEALDSEHRIVWANASPKSRDHPRWLLPVELDAKIGNVVRDVLRGIDAIGIHSLLEKGWQEAGHYGGSGYPVLPGRDAIAFEPSPKKVVVGRPKDVVTDVLLASPNDLYGTLDPLGDACGTVCHVRLEPPAEAPANQMIMHSDLTLGQLR